MIDYYLRARDAKTMKEALAALPAEVTIDEIGILYHVLDEGEAIDELPGYHANVRSTEPISWPESIEPLSPESPRRKFA